MPPKDTTKITLPPVFQKLMRWESLEVVDPRSLGDNPRNWKTHPQSQLDAALVAIQRAGFVLPLLYNVNTNRLLDGHGRKAKCVKAGLTAVPVAKGRWTEEEENFLLQSIDTIGSMYRVDHERLKSLNAMVSEQSKRVTGLKAEHAKTLEKLQTSIGNFARSVEQGEREASPLPLGGMSARKKRKPPEDLHDYDEPEVKEEVAIDDVFFQGDDTFQLPTLLPDLLLTPDQIPTKTYDRSPSSVSEHSWYCLSATPWKEREASGVSGGILGTFCNDYHLRGYYDFPGDYIQELQEWNFTALTQPDFSNYEDWPFPLRLYAAYRSLWVARYWQSHGFRVLPILQTTNFSVRQKNPRLSSGPVDITLENLAALRPPVVACQCRTIKQSGGSFEEFGVWLSNQVKTVKPEVVIVYGREHKAKFEGYLPETVHLGKSRHSISRKVRYVYLPSFMELRRESMKGKKSRGGKKPQE